jgi:hypothetical protein
MKVASLNGHILNSKALPSVPDQQAAAKIIFDESMRKIGLELDKYHIDNQSKAHQIVDYAFKLRVNNVHWKEERIIRKTVEYFKLKPKQ